jgi:hypothetical protein
LIIIKIHIHILIQKINKYIHIWLEIQKVATVEV